MRRAVRHGLVMAVTLLVVLGFGVVATGTALGRWALPWPLTVAVDERDRSGCEPPLVLPAAPEATTVRVLNGTNRSGLASAVGDALRERGFEVSGVGNARSRDEAATIRFQPELEAEALAVAGQLNDHVLVPSPSTTGIVLTLGREHERLRPAEEAVEVLNEPVPSPLGCDGGVDAPAPGLEALDALATSEARQAPEGGTPPAR